MVLTRGSSILQLHGLQEKENKPNDDTFLNGSHDMIGSNLCAPDTLEFVQGILALHSSCELV